MAQRTGQAETYSKRSIADLTLHGTHDSGTYSIKFPKLSKVSGFNYIAKLAKNYSVTQSKTIGEQLNSGVRYLDGSGRQVQIVVFEYTMELSMAVTVLN